MKKKLFSPMVLCAIVIFTLILETKTLLPNLAMANFLKGKVKERGLSCLIDVLEKVNQLGFDVPHEDLTNKIREGVTQSIDITTMLLQFSHLSAQDQKEIIQCNLNQKEAKKRCESVYSLNNCEVIKWGDVSSHNYLPQDDNKVSNVTPESSIPYVSRKCPQDFKRQGCCKCMKRCDPNNSANETIGDKDIHNYCQKHKSYEANVLKDITSLKDPESWKRYQPFGDSFIEKCKNGHTRVGAKLCVAKCPLGWPDLGDRCMKTGDIILMPFVWMVGDDAIASFTEQHN